MNLLIFYLILGYNIYYIEYYGSVCVYIYIYIYIYTYKHAHNVCIVCWVQVLILF